MIPLRHEVVQTRGGARAMRSAEAGEVMHPGVGPLAEADRLYVQQAGLADRLCTGPIVLFDVGLGAGSNARAAWLASETAPKGAGRLSIMSFERDLEALELALVHSEDFGFDGEIANAARTLLRQGEIHTPRTSWRLVHGDVLTTLPKVEERADVIFWDPFSPRANPQLWTVEALSAARAKAAPHGTLFTYSASTTTRVALLLAGWAVGVGSSIGDKGETTAAATQVDLLAMPLGTRFLQRLARSGAAMPSDAGPDAAVRAAAAPQFAAAR